MADRKQPPRRADPERLQEVAKVALAAGTSPRAWHAAVVSHFGVSGQAAGQYIRQARKRGLLDCIAEHAPPEAAPTPVKSAEPRGSWPHPKSSSAVQVVACDDCAFEVPPGDVPKMVRHTLAEHGRPIRPSERTPVRGSAA